MQKETGNKINHFRGVMTMCGSEGIAPCNMCSPCATIVNNNTASAAREPQSCNLNFFKCSQVAAQEVWFRIIFGSLGKLSMQTP